MIYRNEIDGLRALAVLPVVFFHAGLPGFDGGFIGVDVFFVISGYLITSLLITDLSNNRFSLLNFYHRRARRILPALLFLVLVTSMLAYSLMPAELLKEYFLSVLNVGTFTSNLHFYWNSGYFATASEEKPLLHTWSLAVEEQYYLFFPVLLSLLWSKSKKVVITSLTLLTFASFVYCIYLIKSDSLNANFYLIYSRAWELFFGSLLAFFHLPKLQKSKIANELLSLGGLILIVAGWFVINQQTPFPGFATLFPVLGTGLFILFGSPNVLAGRILCLKPLVYIGLISYSLYLWHQPLLAFAKMKTIGHPSLMTLCIAVIGSFLLAHFSCRFIEKPFRNKLFLTQKQVLTLATLCLLALIVLGWYGYKKEGFPNRFKNNSSMPTAQSSPMRKSCHTYGLKFMKPQDSCQYFGDNITWAVLGDSHVVEPAYALAKRLEPLNQGLLHLTFSGCPNAYTLDISHPKGCNEWNKLAVQEIIGREHIKNVLIGYRYSVHLFGTHLPTYPQTPDKSPLWKIDKNFRKSMQGSARENYWLSFAKTVDELIKAGKTVYVMYPIPELPLHISKVTTPFSIFGDKTVLDPIQSVSMAYYKARNEFILNKLNQMEYSSNLKALKPQEVLCDQSHCSAVKSGHALYFDDNHLSLFGAELLTAQIEL